MRSSRLSWTRSPDSMLSLTLTRVFHVQQVALWSGLRPFNLPMSNGVCAAGGSLVCAPTLITSWSQDRMDHLEEVLRRLKEARMSQTKERGTFLVTVCGHTISAEGLRTSDTKVEAFPQAPVPRSVPELRAFLGLVTYYGKFLPDLASVLSPP